MCLGPEIAAVLPWITGGAAVASAVSAMNKPSIPDPPPVPKLEPTPASPTEQTGEATLRPNDQTAVASKKTSLRRAAATMASWTATNKTGGMGLTTQAPTQKTTLLGGSSTKLGV
jgi:hypothetical protein